MELTYTAHEAALVLKTHYQTVLKLIRDQILPAARIGRCYVIRESAIATLLAESENDLWQASRIQRSDPSWPSTGATTGSGMPASITAASDLDALCAQLTSKPRKKHTTK